MSERVRRLASPLLGISGSGIGLVWAYILLSSNWGEFGPVGAFFGWPLLVGSVLGLAGACLYPWSRRIGGTFLLIGGIVVSPSWLFVAIANFGALVVLGAILAPCVLVALLLLLAGLLSFQKSRRVIKILHEGGWIP